ncbi:MAG: DUF1549 domain-containing protein, partial [Planctomycetota bacterium]
MITLLFLVVANPILAAGETEKPPKPASITRAMALPASIHLHQAGDRANVILTEDREGVAGSIINDEGLVWSVDNPSIAKIEGERIVGLKPGSTQAHASIKNTKIASLSIQVQGEDDGQPPTFRNDVQNVLSKLGCNMGACHGALAGKGGFRLSLRGYDSEADFQSIRHQARGRRVELADPGRSLLLAKPTGILPHKGGLKLDAGSTDYQTLANWIAAGAAGPTHEDPILETISVTPAQSLLYPGETTRVLVRGHYDDGRVVDVTHWAQFTATDEAVAGVDDDGVVSVRGSGEAAVLVWFGSKVALARLTVPYPYEVAQEVYAKAPRENFIDDLNLVQLETLNLEPSPRCDDETFLRRATLDTIGRLPTEEERETFLKDTPENRRCDLVERLLASEDYTDYWTYLWSDVLVINGTRLRPIAVKTYYEWLRNSVAENKPWNHLVSEILTATGESDKNGATNFYALNQSPEEMTEAACQAFMGLSIGCAKCHNHPLEKWTNDQYYAMANLFARVRAKGWGGDGRNGDGKRTLYVSTDGDLIQPNRGKPQPPAPLDAPPLDIDDPSDRREALAAWMTGANNPYFARAITNRIWRNFFGRGLVEQVDDLRLSNPASNEPMLEATADYLVGKEFDLKELMRLILNSETYARSSEPLETNAAELKYNSRYYPRRLMAEVLLDCIDQTLKTRTAFNRIEFPGNDFQDTEFYGEDTRAIELFDSAVESYFLTTFGRNPREIVC